MIEEGWRGWQKISITQHHQNQRLMSLFPYVPNHYSCFTLFICRGFPLHNSCHPLLIPLIYTLDYTIQREILLFTIINWDGFNLWNHLIMLLLSHLNGSEFIVSNHCSIFNLINLADRSITCCGVGGMGLFIFILRKFTYCLFGSLAWILLFKIYQYLIIKWITM